MVTDRCAAIDRNGWRCNHHGGGVHKHSYVATWPPPAYPPAELPPRCSFFCRRPVGHPGKCMPARASEAA